MNKVVLVTGASSGIGEATALKFASCGYDVVINYLSNIDNANKIRDKIISDYGVRCICIGTDVSNENSVIDMVDKVISEFGHIDVLVNNAGISLDSTLEDKSVSDFRRVIDVNLVSIFIVSKYVAKYMKSGSIINISSTNGDNSNYYYSMDYDASKAGVNILTKDLADALGPNIRVNAVAPGWVNTPMNKDMDDEFKNDELKKIVMERFAKPEEIANVVYFLANDDASYVNGTVITVDGGRKGSV